MADQKYPPYPILAVDDEQDVLDSYRLTLKYSGINNLRLCQQSTEVIPLLKKEQVSLIILDLIMPDLSGQDLLKMINQEYPHIPVIIITSANQVDTAVQCMRLGAFDYIVKPVEKSRLLASIKRALEIGELKQELGFLKKQMLSDKIEHPEIFESIITVSSKMKSIFKYIEAIATSPKPILITGESGVGKEIIARAIHQLSGLQGEFVCVNIAGLDDTMFSDTLFGHKKGAFTGAINERKGLIEKAAGGTLFLDEIGDLESASQIKILRLVQENEYYPLGADTARISSARIITATNADLKNKQTDGSFRKDLFYRLMIHHIQIPPLRDRTEDIPFLADAFLTEAAHSLSKEKPEIPAELSALLASFHFPGNIRELQSLLFDAVSRHKSGKLSLSLFKEYIKNNQQPGEKATPKLSIQENRINYQGHFPTLEEVEEYFINQAMEKAGGNQSIAAQLLGVSQSTLSRRFKKKTDK